MSKKSEIKKAIAESEQEIADLEIRRNRSQSALLQSFLDNSKPNKNDAEYYRVYSQLIDLERAKLRKLNADLKKLENDPNAR